MKAMSRGGQKKMGDFFGRINNIDQCNSSRGTDSAMDPPAYSMANPPGSVCSQQSLGFCSQQSRGSEGDIQMTPDCAVFPLEWDAQDHSARLMPPTPHAGCGFQLSQAEGTNHL